MKFSMKKNNLRRLAFPISAALIVFLSIFGPEALAQHQDKKILGEIHAEASSESGAGYRYTLNADEKVYILSRCLSSQTLPETESHSLTHQETGGTYAFVINRRGPSGKEITDEEIYETCNDGIAALQELDILPDGIRAVDEVSYDATLYSAIDIPEPGNNVSVWKVSLSDSLTNADKTNRLIDAYIDADTGKLYEFYVRTQLEWDEIDPDQLVEAWRSYLGMSSPRAYEANQPLLETTPYYKKYVFAGMGEETTVVTVGLYEGIGELFLKISK